MNFLSLAFHNLVEFINAPETLTALMANRFYLILLVIVLSSFKHASYSSMWLASLINMPGTFLHETAHFVVGLVLNAKPTSFSLFPRKNGDYYVMGSVGFKNLTFYNALPSSMAPLFLLIAGFYLNKHFFDVVNVSIWTYMLYVLLQTIIVENAMPSRADFKAGFKYFSGVLLYSVVMVLYLALFF